MKYDTFVMQIFGQICGMRSSLQVMQPASKRDLMRRGMEMKGLKRSVIRPIQEFPASLRQLLDERGISASELARMMAYKSRNSIFRILDGAGGQSARQAFYDRLIGEDPLKLTDHERAMLAQAIEVSRMGQRAFVSSCAMRDMLLSKDAGAAAVHIDMPSESDDPGFRQAMQEMVRGRQTQVVILGCCYREIFEELREHIYRGEMTCDVKVRHLLYTGEEEIVANIAAIQPMLYCDSYTAYCVEPGLLSPEREKFYRQNTIYILMQDHNGQWYAQTFLLVSW